MKRCRKTAKDRIVAFVQAGVEGYRQSETTATIHRQRTEGVVDPCLPCRERVCNHWLDNHYDCEVFIGGLVAATPVLGEGEADVLRRFGLGHYENPSVGGVSDPVGHLIEHIGTDEDWIYLRVGRTVKKDLLADAFSETLDWLRGVGAYTPRKRHTGKIMEYMRAYSLESQGLTHKDIARKLGIPLSTVGYRCRQMRPVVTEMEKTTGKQLPCRECPRVNNCTPKIYKDCAAMNRFMAPLKGKGTYSLPQSDVIAKADDLGYARGHKHTRIKSSSWEDEDD